MVRSSAGSSVLRLVLLAGEGLPDHVAADKQQQNKGDPVVILLDISRKLRTKYPPQKGHQCLKAAEIQSHRQGMAPFDPRHGQALTDRHGEGVHRQSHADEEQLKKSHID